MTEKPKINPRNTIKKTPGPGRPPKHGAYITKKDDPELRTWLRSNEAAMLEDLGGPDRMAAKQQFQVQNALRVMRILYCMDRYLADHDIVKPSGKLQDVLVTSYLAYVNSLSRILQSLDLEKRVMERDETLERYLKAKSKGAKNGSD